jgi:hypothetical protein
MSDFLINGIPFEESEEKDGKIITLLVSKYATQEQIDKAMKKVQFQYSNSNLSKIIVKKSKGESFA